MKLSKPKPAGLPPIAPKSTSNLVLKDPKNQFPARVLSYPLPPPDPNDEHVEAAYEEQLELDIQNDEKSQQSRHLLNSLASNFQKNQEAREESIR